MYIFLVVITCILFISVCLIITRLIKVTGKEAVEYEKEQEEGRKLFDDLPGEVLKGQSLGW